MVEHCLHTAGVTGSNPVLPTMLKKPRLLQPGLLFFCMQLSRVDRCFCLPTRLLEDKVAGLARLATRFLLLSQKKSGKEKAAPCQGLRLPCATRPIKRLRNSAWLLTNFVSNCGLQTVLAENSWLVCVARLGSRGLKAKPNYDCHSSYRWNPLMKVGVARQISEAEMSLEKVFQMWLEAI